ncbi:MAG: D-alanine--D-alanine ligase, partial [Acidobacteriota bacterium]
MDRKDQPRIGVVCGGSSPEAEVSRRSAEAVAEALKSTYRAVRLMELDQMLPWTLVEGRVDVVFPALHGPPGEDGTFQGFLEIAGIPYVGSGVVASALAMDKVAAKGIFRTHELPVAPDLVVSRQEGSQAAARRVADRLGTDVVIKPSSQGSALGVRFARDLAGIQAAVEGAFQYDTRVLVEEKICGKEITVGILEREEATALPVIEIRTPEGTWYDYEHRYTPGLSEHVIPAGLT